MQEIEDVLFYFFFIKEEFEYQQFAWVIVV